MKPDRSNYEIWITDWFAGNLSGEQKELLIRFLEQNPDLRDEAESLSLTILTPDNRSFEPKRSLKKSPEELHPSQVEYLSVAFLEQDLSSEQIEDLNNCINNNPDSKKIFESVSKIKLVPPVSRYQFKDRLKKKSTFEKVLHLALPIVRIAAVIAIIALSFVFVPKIVSLKKDEIAVNKVPQSEPVILYSRILTAPEEEIITPALSEKTNISASPGKIKTSLPDNPVSAGLSYTDSSVILPVIFREPAISSIIDFPGLTIDITDKPAVFQLVASKIEYHEPAYDDRNGFSKFLARTIREKILREDTGSDAPVKPYEIASAGINGLSRLFGLQMALVKVNDEQGEMKSLYFSSGLLKINAPVKKNEASQ